MPASPLLGFIPCSLWRLGVTASYILLPSQSPTYSLRTSLGKSNLQFLIFKDLSAQHTALHFALWTLLFPTYRNPSKECPRIPHFPLTQLCQAIWLQPPSLNETALLKVSCLSTTVTLILIPSVFDTLPLSPIPQLFLKCSPPLAFKTDNLNFFLLLPAFLPP